MKKRLAKVFALTVAFAGGGCSRDEITAPITDVEITARKEWACTYTELNGSVAESCEWYENDCTVDPTQLWCQGSPIDSDGNSGGGGSGTGSGTGSASFTPNAPGNEGDASLSTIPPACATPKDQFESIWCTKSAVPLGTELSRINASLQRLIARGGVCAQRASMIQALIGNQTLKMYNQADLPSAGGGAPMFGGVNGWMILSRNWTLYYYDGAHAENSAQGRRYLDGMLVHEADHLAGLHHVPGTNAYRTPNEVACAP